MLGWLTSNSPVSLDVEAETPARCYKGCPDAATPAEDSAAGSPPARGARYNEGVTRRRAHPSGGSRRELHRGLSDLAGSTLLPGAAVAFAGVVVHRAEQPVGDVHRPPLRGAGVAFGGVYRAGVGLGRGEVRAAARPFGGGVC